MTTLFRIIAFLEGVSYILLLGFASPYRIFTGDKQYVQMLGMPHGILFILYLILAYLIKDNQEWDKNRFIKVLLASVIPFGTFYVEAKWLKK